MVQDVGLALHPVLLLHDGAVDNEVGGVHAGFGLGALIFEPRSVALRLSRSSTH